MCSTAWDTIWMAYLCKTIVGLSYFRYCCLIICECAGVILNRARARETVVMTADRGADTTIRGSVLSTQSYEYKVDF